MSVHVLYQGAALCGLRGLPREWPEGESWVPTDDANDVTCGACKMGLGLVDPAAGGLLHKQDEATLAQAGAGTMEVISVELNATDRQLRVGEPRTRCIEVILRGIPVTPETPATRVTYVRRLLLWFRAHQAMVEQVDLQFGPCREARFRFTVDNTHVKDLFEVVRL